MKFGLFGINNGACAFPKCAAAVASAGRGSLPLRTPLSALARRTLGLGPRRRLCRRRLRGHLGRIQPTDRLSRRRHLGQLVALGRRLRPQLQLEVGDCAEGLALADRSADTVQALGWLHWEPRYAAALAELWRLTRRWLFFDVRIALGDSDVTGAQALAFDGGRDRLRRCPTSSSPGQPSLSCSSACRRPPSSATVIRGRRLRASPGWMRESALPPSCLNAGQARVRRARAWRLSFRWSGRLISVRCHISVRGGWPRTSPARALEHLSDDSRTPDRS